MNSFRNDLNKLSSSISQMQEQQKTEQRKNSSSAPDISATLLQAVREEIRNVGASMEQAQTMQNLRAELAFRRLLSTDAQERRDFKEAILAFGRFIEQRDEALEKKVELMDNQVKEATATKAAMKFTIEQLITTVRELLEIA